jgi:hypothetical protein
MIAKKILGHGWPVGDFHNHGRLQEQIPGHWMAGW